MKLRITHFATLAAFALGAGAHAATITWGSVTAISSSSDVSTTGTLVTAAYMGNSGAQTVGGVTFSAANLTTGTNSYSGFDLGSVDAVFTAAAVDNRPAGVTGSYQTILNTMGEGFTGSPTLTFTLTGLTNNQQYQLQFWAADYRTAFGDLNRSETLTAGNTSSALSFLRASSPDNSLSGNYILGTFTADGTTQSITINGTGDAIVNAFQVRAIPEPSAALLGGLGMLCLLRRRR